MTKRAEGRIVRSLSGFYDVETAEGLVTCRARGILRKEGNSPLTGDLVEITVTAEGVYAINYYGTMFNCVPTATGFDMDYYGTMTMHFTPAE